MTQELEQTTETTGGLKNRTITTTVSPLIVVNQDGSMAVTKIFSMPGVDPDVPDMRNRLTTGGNLDMENIDDVPGYNKNVDLVLNLNTDQLLNPTFHVTGGRWATADEYSGTGPVTGFAWFCRAPATPSGTYNTTPVPAPGMSVQRNSDTQIQINDDTDDNAPAYAYCLGLTLFRDGMDDLYVPLDPIISSRGIGGGD